MLASSLLDIKALSIYFYSTIRNVAANKEKAVWPSGPRLFLSKKPQALRCGLRFQSSMSECYQTAAAPPRVKTHHHQLPEKTAAVLID